MKVLLPDAVRVRNLTKRFRRDVGGRRSVFGKLRAAAAGDGISRTVTAVREISFTAAPGEMLGIVGRNGSGKTTLLKLVCGILPPTEGTVQTRGPIAPFFQWGLGFQQELTVRENLFLYGAVLGIPRRTLRARRDRIASFAELDGLLDARLGQLSSGMQARLAFSVALESDARILVFDEAFSVGDCFFEEKCLREIGVARARGATLLVASHALSTLERHCDRILLLENGNAVALGAPAEVLGLYGRRKVDIPAPVL